MFLSDELYKKRMEVDIKNFASVKKMVFEMINICIKRITETDKRENVVLTIAEFHRTNNAWKSASKKLKKNDKDIVKENGFELYIKAKPEFKGIFK